MIKIAICDDDAAMVQILVRMIEGSTVAMDKEIKMSNFSTSSQMMESMIQGDEYHMIFMDIKLDSGHADLELLRSIKLKYSNILMVFTSSDDQYYTHMVRCEPFRSLRKPYNSMELNQVLVDAFRQLLYCGVNYVVSAKNGSKIGINLGDIMYIYSKFRTCNVVDQYREVSSFYKRLDAVYNEISLVYPYFIRISKNCLVNYLFTSKFDLEDVWLINGEKLKINSSYQQDLNRKLMDIVGKKIDFVNCRFIHRS